MVLPSFDASLEIDDLGRLEVQVEPGLKAVEKGWLLEGTFIEVTEISKTNTGDSQSHLLLHKWKSSNSLAISATSPLQSNPLSNYASHSPLGHPGTPWLCTWTLLSPLWPPAHRAPLPILPRNFDMGKLKSLASLDSVFISSSSLPHLLVRMLAVSRTRLKPQQGNPTKPWIALKNILVADKTGHTVLTLWDAAVEETVGNWREGDLLLLEGSYRIARHRDPIKDRLAPKLRHLAVSPTEMEVKVNSRDLAKISLIASGATAPNLPQSLCSFRDVKELREGRLAQDRPVDFVGTVLHLGRWERQACSRRESYCDPDSAVFYTGQFWVRLWLQLADHSSSSTISVKLYLDQEQWTMALAALPGTTIILTNLLYKHSIKNGGFSHLESSTETQIFCGAAAEDGRFTDEVVVARWREAAVEKEEEMRCRVEQEGSFGGHWLPEEVGRLDQVPLLENKQQLLDCLSNLAWRAGARIRVRGVIVEENEEWGTLCPGQPGWGSLSRKIDGLAAGSLLKEVQAYCQLDKCSKDEEYQMKTPSHTKTANIALSDCILMVQISGQDMNFSERGAEMEFCVDLFRLHPSADVADHGLGVEAVVRQVVVGKRKAEEEDLTHSKRKKSESGEEREDSGLKATDGYESDCSVHTPDLLELFA